MDAMTVAIDIANTVFEVAVSTAKGQIQKRHRFTRRQFSTFLETVPAGTVVIMEACGSAHHWGRQCQQRGATVRLLPARYVRPYVRRNKTDRTDVEALLEAHRCSGIQAVPVKTIEQQSLQALHRVRVQWQKTRTARINTVRAVCRELGILLPVGTGAAMHRAAALVAATDAALPPLTLQTIRWLLDELAAIETQLTALDRQLTQIARTHYVAARLLQVPGIGIVTATALVASVPHIHAFQRGRQFASWLGVTPSERSSGNRRVLGRMSKQGNRYLRTLLAHGARSVLRAGLARRQRHQPPGRHLADWAVDLAERRGRNRATIAVANKLARIVWAVWTRDCDFVERAAA